ncbi:MAG: pilus assembly protein [Rickettsiales bacterium]|nr:pilus assembly protein [Rickettsiales bacterium]
MDSISYGQPKFVGVAVSESSNSFENGRIANRVAVEVRVDLRSENTFFTGFSENISEGGLFIATEAPHQIGDEFQIELALMGGGQKISQRAVVRWIRPAEAAGGLPAGMGVQFLELSHHEREALQEFIDSQIKDTLFYDLD